MPLVWSYLGHSLAMRDSPSDLMWTLQPGGSALIELSERFLR